MHACLDVLTLWAPKLRHAEMNSTSFIHYLCADATLLFNSSVFDPDLMNTVKKNPCYLPRDHGEALQSETFTAWQQ